MQSLTLSIKTVVSCFRALFSVMYLSTKRYITKIESKARTIIIQPPLVASSQMFILSVVTSCAEELIASAVAVAVCNKILDKNILFFV